MITWNRVGLKISTTLLNTELAFHQNILTITGTDISYFPGNFSCTVSNIKGNNSREVGPYEGIYHISYNFLIFRPCYIS